MSNIGDGTITEITPAGAQSTFVSGFTDPYGMAFDRAGDLFAADIGNSTIAEITPGGVPSIFASGLSPAFLTLETEPLTTPEPSTWGLMAVVAALAVRLEPPRGADGGSVELAASPPLLLPDQDL